MKTEKGLSVETDLSPLEYNELLMIANDPAGIDLQGHLLATDISGLPLYQQQRTIKAIMDEAFSAARKQLLYNSDYSGEIQQRIQDRTEQIRDVGLGAK